ncbi:hypothetical protein [Nocardioides sp. TF02-7]|uniref:hypothetical protein n=1 Tax=Nocardioides sp. TF02-7 TaxID=2917724 RepID=UPI001F06895B|nr:hypothetical protein [Nocardioides sp. TF02-7]UMG93833.1 hypothetical protein MF408_06785 [Nocardioides sp. TF02-7]
MRSSIIGAAAGVVLLGGIVGFAVGLPEVVGEGSDVAAATDRRPVAELLPEDLLDGELQRIGAISPQFTEMADQVESYGADRLSEAFGGDVAVARYATSGLDTEVSITVYDGESTFFLPTGPPIPPELSAQQGLVNDVQQVGDAVCTGQWQAQAYQQGGAPFQNQCQRVVDGRTFNAHAGGGYTLEQTAEALADVVAQAG